MKRLSDTELCLEGYEFLEGYCCADDAARRKDRQRLEQLWLKSAKAKPNGEWPEEEVAPQELWRCTAAP